MYDPINFVTNFILLKSWLRKCSLTDTVTLSTCVDQLWICKGTIYFTHGRKESLGMRLTCTYMNEGAYVI